MTNIENDRWTGSKVVDVMNESDRHNTEEATMTLSYLTQTGSHPRPSRPHLSERFIAEALPLRPQLARAARGYTKNAQDAEDLVQETYAKAWAAYASFDTGTNLRAWMFRIMVNTWISTHRRAERRPQESLTDSFTDSQLAAEWSPALSSAESQALRRLPNHDIARAMSTLPETLQAVVYHADICQLPYREIAAIEGIPLGTVMSRLHRARRQLRAALCETARAHGCEGCGPRDVAA
jgi:RNA polymerase sigma-70 factor (ECF subfamily)